MQDQPPVHSSPQFQTELQKLNPAQRRAVDLIEGPVLVVAGPGTGKTQVLAMRIANILMQTDTAPASILALTFTEAAAQNMRRRLVSLIGRAGYEVRIATFHSFCQTVIQDYPEFFELGRDSQPLGDVERFELLQQLIADLPLDVLKPLNAPEHYLRELMTAISNLKRENISPPDLAKLIDQELAQLEADRTELSKGALQKQERLIAKHQELLQVFVAYQQQLAERNRYDYEDMIGLVNQSFLDNEELLLEYQENLLYILVDEYQDTNAAQNRVVELLSKHWGQQANVFAVGDPNQAIYRFQGASLENMLEFLELYPSAEVVGLKVGYRCPQTVYNRAQALISEGQQTIGSVLAKVGRAELAAQADQPLKSAQDNSSDQAAVRFYAAPSETLELIFVAEEIQALLNKGVLAEQIAVLFRHNQDAIVVQEVFEKWQIPYELDVGVDVLKTQLARQLLALLETIQAVGLDRADGWLFEVSQFEWSALSSDVGLKLARTASQLRHTMVQTVMMGYQELSQQIAAKPNATLDLTEAEFQQIEAFVKWCDQQLTTESNQVFPAWLEQIFDQSGLLKWVLDQPNKTELLVQLNSIFGFVKSAASQVRGRSQYRLTDFLTTVQTMYEHGLSLPAEDLNIEQGAVRLSTAHKAKGQEWPYVFVIHAWDNKWGNTRRRELLPLPTGVLRHTDVSEIERNADDRRLMYVALTRASRQVTISYAETTIKNNRSSDQIPSMFLAELAAGQTDEVTALLRPDLVSKADAYLEKLIGATTGEASAQQLPAKDLTYITQLAEQFVLSATSLNDYLTDPAEFYLKHIIRVPRAKLEHMAYGTAVHAALEKFYQYWHQHQKVMTEQALHQTYHLALSRELLTDQDFERRLASGRETLSNYLKHFQSQQSAVAMPDLHSTEKFFGTTSQPIMLGDTPIKGRVDRIDWLDTSTKKVRLVDYKTGKPKSVNFINGQTKSQSLSEREQTLPAGIRGSYKRQLLFYKLLTQADATFKATAESGSFEFVEGNGKVIVREFEFEPQDLTDLSELIRQVRSEILELKGWQAGQ